MSKNEAETEGSQMTSQYGAYALCPGLARLYARMRVKTPTRSGTNARTHKHVHTDQYVILIAFTQQEWFRQRASILRYTYIASLDFSKVKYTNGYKLPSYYRSIL